MINRRVAEQWTHFGFQQADPVSDIRGGGVLSVKLLIYFLREHRVCAEGMLLRQKAGVRSRESIEVRER
jgi:hypothetical protein